jgi:cobaltochelatase CobT
MNKKKQSLIDSLPIIAAALGDKLSINVTIGGDGAWTDSKRINLPYFEIDSKKDRDALLGYLSHEAAHIKFNSFSVNDPDGELTFITPDQPKNPLLFSLTNAFEDVRIENLMKAHMIGTRHWIDEVFIKLIREGKWFPKGVGAHPSSILFDYILRYSRFHYGKQDFIRSQLDVSTNCFIETFGYDLLLKINQLIDEQLPVASSVDDVFALAKDVIRCVEEHDPEEDSDDDSDGSGQEEDSDDDSDGSGQEEDSDEGSDGSGQEEDSDDDSQGNSQGSAVNNKASVDDGDSNDNLNTIKSAIKAALDELPHDFDDGLDSYKELINSEATVVANVAPSILKAMDAEKGGNGREIINASRKASSGLSAKLQALVEESVKTHRRLDKAGLALSNRDLYRYKVGDPHLFVQESDSIGIDSIVEVTLDNSGSMSMYVDCCKKNSPLLIDVAKEAQLALISALDRINGVSTTASLFPVDFSLSKSRAIDIETPVNLKGESDSVKTLANNIANYANANGWSTPSATALWNSISNVLSSKRNRKIILFITDGEPDYNQTQPLINLVKKAEAEGIIIIGVGIGDAAKLSSNLEQYFSKSIYIQNANDIKKELFKVASNLLVG